MKKLIVLTVLAGIAVTVARKFNIGLEDLKNMIFPKLQNIAAKVKMN